MRIPKQFLFKSKEEEHPDPSAIDADNYFSFQKATDENVPGQKTGHPLVPRLNLPRPDPNDQWREMMAQAQSYEVESSSSLPSNFEVSSSSGHANAS